MGFETNNNSRVFHQYRNFEAVPMGFETNYQTHKKQILIDFEAVPMGFETPFSICCVFQF